MEIKKYWCSWKYTNWRTYFWKIGQNSWEQISLKNKIVLGRRHVASSWIFVLRYKLTGLNIGKVGLYIENALGLFTPIPTGLHCLREMCLGPCFVWSEMALKTEGQSRFYFDYCNANIFLFSESLVTPSQKGGVLV